MPIVLSANPLALHFRGVTLRLLATSLAFPGKLANIGSKQGVFDGPAGGSMAEAGVKSAIPTPPGMPVLGNMLTVDSDAPLQSLMQLTRDNGPIYQLNMMGTPLVVVSGASLVEEICDESRFDKAVRGSLRRIRVGCRRRAVHQRYAGAELEQGAQHPVADLRAARHGRLSAADARHRRPALHEMGAAERRRRDRRRARHDGAGARHDRRLRLRLPLQFVLPARLPSRSSTR